MENVKFTRNGDKLIVEIDLKYRGNKSASGKSVTVASTRGNAEVPGTPELKIGINCYVKA